MVSVSEVLHGLELLVDDANASLVSAVHDAFDVLGALAHGLELLVDALGGLNSGLRVELGCERSAIISYKKSGGQEILPG